MIQTREECEREGERFRGKKREIKNREKIKIDTNKGGM